MCLSYLTITLTMLTFYDHSIYYFPQGFYIAHILLTLHTLITFRLQNLCAPLLELI